jgi:hypothetical protein
VANHLTPTELADEVNMKRREVIAKCMEMGVPIFNGRIDKTLFVSSLRHVQQQGKQQATEQQATASHAGPPERGGATPPRIDFRFGERPAAAGA